MPKLAARRGYSVLSITLFVLLVAVACGESSSPLAATPRPSLPPTGIAINAASPNSTGGAPTATVATAVPQTPPPMSVDPAVPLATITDPRREAMLAYLDRLTQSGQFMGAVLVADKGDILVNEGFGFADVAAVRPNTPQTQLRIGSLSKQFTAAAILRLAQEGLLTVDDTVATFIPDYPNGDQITIHHLLTHTSGVPNYEQRPDLRQVVGSPIPLDDLIASFAGQPLLFPPGQGYAYSSSGYVLLTKIIEVVSGQPYAGYVRTELLEPVGMGRSGYDFLDPALPEPATGYQLTPGGPQPAIITDSSWPSGAGALYSTAADLYRWDRALYSDALLSAASRAAMFTPWVADTGNGTAYGYGWELGTMSGRETVSHGGAIFGFASYLARFPQDDAVIIVLSNGTQVPPRLVTEELAGILFASSGS